MIQADRDERARSWRSIIETDFLVQVAIDFKLEAYQKRIREMYPAEFDSEQGSTP